MKLNMFKIRKINPLFVLILALGAVVAFLVMEYVLSIVMVFGLCENCFAKAVMLIGAVFAISNIINVSVIAAIGAVTVIIWNRICVAEYKANVRKVKRITVIQNKRKNARRHAKQPMRCTEEWVFE